MVVRKCAEPGCDTLVVGGFCLEHDMPATRVFVRGRPFIRAEPPAVVAAQSQTMTTTTFARPVGERLAPGFTKAGARLPSSG